MATQKKATDKKPAPKPRVDSDETIRKFALDTGVNYEDFSDIVYPDSVGHPTIGFGFNLDEPATVQYLTSKGYNVNALRNKQAKISRPESEKILTELFTNAYDNARTFVSNFDALPEQARYILADMTYNMGPSRLANFKQMKAAFENNNFNEAAKQLKNSKYYNQVGRRSKTHYNTLLDLTAKSEPKLDFVPNFPVLQYTNDGQKWVNYPAQVGPTQGNATYLDAQPSEESALQPKIDDLGWDGFHYVKKEFLPQRAKPTLWQSAKETIGEWLNDFESNPTTESTTPIMPIFKQGGDIPYTDTTNKGNSYYEPLTQTITLSDEDRHIPGVYPHEWFHYWQNMNGYDRIPEFYPGPLKQPTIPSGDDSAKQYWNRRAVDQEIMTDEFLSNNPSFNFVHPGLVYNKAVNPTMYNRPWTLEGEARQFEQPFQGPTPYPQDYGYKQGGLIKRADGSYSRRGLWDNIRANRGSGKKPTAEMLRQERKIKKHEDGSWVTNSSLPTPTSPSFYAAGADRTLTNYQMGTPKARMYAMGSTVDCPCPPSCNCASYIPATRNDSLMIYNNTIALNNFLASKGYKQQSIDEAIKDSQQRINSIKERIARQETNVDKTESEDYRKTEKPKDEIGIKYQQNKINNYNKVKEEQEKGTQLNSYKEGLKNIRDGYITSVNNRDHTQDYVINNEIVYNVKNPKIEDYYQKINDYQFKQREASYTKLNLDAPMPIYDLRITPQYYNVWLNDDSTGNGTNDRVEVYSYDPLAVKPYKDRTEEEKIEWEKRYGTKPATRYFQVKQEGDSDKPWENKYFVSQQGEGRVDGQGLKQWNPITSEFSTPNELGTWHTIGYNEYQRLKEQEDPKGMVTYQEFKRNGGPVMYNAGSTVWTKQDTPLWAAGTPTPTATQNFRNDRSLNTDRYRIGDVIPTGMDYKSPAAGTKDYSIPMTSYDWNNQRRLHAPDTTIMARRGGHVNSPRVYGNPITPSGMYKDGGNTNYEQAKAQYIAASNKGIMGENQMQQLVKQYPQLANDFSLAGYRSVGNAAMFRANEEHNRVETNSLGQVLSTPESRKKAYRQEVVTRRPGVYNVEDYKMGIQEPGATNDITDDPLAMAVIGTATGGVGLGARGATGLANSFARNLAAEATFGAADLTKGGFNLTKRLFENAPQRIKNLGESLKSTKSLFNEVKGEILHGNANRKAIQEGNDWFANWVAHPKTQEKIEASINDRINLHNQYYHSAVKDALDKLNAGDITKEQFDKVFIPNINLNYKSSIDELNLFKDQAKNFKNYSQEYPLANQFKENFLQYFGKGEKNIHLGNAGVSESYYRTPFTLDSDPLNLFSMRDKGNWISRKYYSPLKKIGTTIHENTHGWTTRFGMNNAGQTNLVLNNITKEAKDRYLKWKQLGVNAKKEMGEKEAFKGYIAHPTEMHARTMELRKAFDLTPDDIVDEEMAKDMMRTMESNRNIITGQSEYLDTFGKDPKKMANLFNGLWMAAPGAVVVGNEYFQQNNNNMQKQANGGYVQNNSSNTWLDQYN